MAEQRGWIMSVLVFVVTCRFGPLCSATDLDTRNLILNGGFEEDDHNLRGEVMACPVRARVTYGQSDGLPDRWQFIYALKHPLTSKYLAKVRDRHSGAYAILLKPSGRYWLNQSFTYAVHEKAQQMFPAIRFSAWVKGMSGTDAIVVRLSLKITEKDEKKGKYRSVPLLEVKKEFPAPLKWAKVSFDVSSDEIVNALKERKTIVGLISGLLAFQTSKGSQTVTLGDIALECARTPAPYTLVPNAGFETVTEDGQPAAWSRAKKSLRYFGSNYYVWRDWFHFFSLPRGVNAIDRLVVRAGEYSFRMNVPPGDDKHIESASIPLNQTEPRRMALQFDYNSYLLANLMVQVVDDAGREVFAKNLVVGTSGGWRTCQTVFMPCKTGRKAGDVRSGGDLYGAVGGGIPLKACRVRIGVKGVNGSEMDDINEWGNVNHAGVLWIDNVALTEVDSTAAEIAARAGKTYPLDMTAPPLAVESIDLGERLYGENVATVTVANRGERPATVDISMRMTGPYREMDPKKAGYAVGAVGQAEPVPATIKEQTQTAKLIIAPGTRALVPLPYTIQRLLKDWRSEYRMSISMGNRSCEIPFGTWSQQAVVEVQRCYQLSDFEAQPVFMNIGVARRTLSKVERLRLEVRRVRDDERIIVQEIPEFQTAVAELNAAPLPPGYQGDNTNFFQAALVTGKLPVHPQTRPVRDHYARVIGLDVSGNAVFTGRSPRFGRMEPHRERLAPIKNVKIHEGNYLLVNNRPFFCRGHIWMQQNCGPSPLARRNTDWKRYGFNVKAATQSPFSDTGRDRYGTPMQRVWQEHKTYVGSQMIATKGPMTDEIKADIQKWITKPYIIGLHFIPWEGGPGGTPEESIKYAKEIRAVKGTRPLWVSSGWYAPAVNGGIIPANIENDWFMPENNSYFQPSQLDKSVLPKKRKRGEPCVLGTYPNVFNDCPWPVQRFEHWTEIIRHHTGYMQIGKPGDPTLMAGLNGEFRFIESFLFSKQKTPAVEVEPSVEHVVRATRDATYILATNAGPVIGGDWEWSTEIRDQGRASHTGAALWNRLHDYMKDTYSHFYKDDRPVVPKKGDKLVQHVFIPDGANVDHLILMACGDAEWRHHAVWGNFDHQELTDGGVRLWLAKDMHQMAWGSIGIGFCGPQGHDIKHPKLLEYTFTQPQFRKIGALPTAGKWARLEVPVETIGLDGMVVDGFGFVSKGAKVWWERTILVQDGKETVLCDGSAGIPPEQLARVRFNVAGLTAGTKIKVCFEERDLIAQDGYFEDDLSGRPGYRNMWVGLYGDKIGETGYYGDGYFYNYNCGKVAARLYEIPASR